METVGIRELTQNASAIVAAAAAGAEIVITDRGRPVARMGPIAGSALDRLRAAGRVRDATGSLADLPVPEPLTGAGASLSKTIAEMRAGERY